MASSLFRCAGRAVAVVVLQKSAANLPSLVVKCNKLPLVLLCGPVVLGLNGGAKKTTPHNNQPIFVQVTFVQRFRLALLRLWSRLKVILRTVQMCLILTPLLVTVPLAWTFDSLKDPWLRLLVGSVQCCGPVFVKLGQWASTRRDLFPASLCDHLAKLQRQATSHDWHHTRCLLEQTFGGKANVDAIFADINPVPVGSGCCAQVYQAWLNVQHLTSKTRGQLILDNRWTDKQLLEVAVKVLHPNIEARFARDLAVMRSVVGLATWLCPSLKWLSLEESLEEFAALMNIQVDLANEAENLQQFRADFVGSRKIIFPMPITELCKKAVIVETFESGFPISEIVRHLDKTPDKIRGRLADIGVDMLLTMVFRNNFVHADLHPGNILVRGLTDPATCDVVSSGCEKELQLVILDPGLSASLPPNELRNFNAVFTAVAKGDGRKVGELFLQSSVQQCEHPLQFIEQMNSIVVDARSKQLNLASVDVAFLLSRVFSTLQTHKVKLDHNFISVILSIMVLEGLGRTLNPDMDLLWKATPYLLKGPTTRR